MRFGALIPFLAFALAACGRDAPPAPPLGTFVLDAEAMSRALVAQGTPEKAARRQAAAGRARLVFDPAGTFTLVVRDEGGRVERSAGRWSRDGALLTLTTTTRAGKPLEPAQAVRARLDGDQLTIDPERQGVLPFVMRRE
ncbi:MAG: hypothetical protein QNJ98_15370 [Planctomycetota bacterium]|nr:hypothetical protein [Planctomycetota bacterium]